LSEAQALGLLALPGQIYIPDTVKDELAYHVPNWQKPNWLTVGPLAEPHSGEALAWHQAGLLHLGEAEAIALARQLRADWLLTDDTAARLMGQALGLEVHGSLGIVLWAAAAGHLDGAQANLTLERLARSSLWVSPRVLGEARTALVQLFRRSP
jgi:predicted nucleic acid-binding protein